MLRTPKQLTKTLQASIIGQDTGVRTIATAIAAHLVRINHNRRDPEHPIKKDNVLIIGPTGTGKSETVRTIIREYDLPIPVVVANAANLSPSGFKNKNTESILDDLVKDAFRIILKNPKDYISSGTEDQQRKEALEAAIQLANQGIIVLDEVDKQRINPVACEDENFFPRKIQEQILKAMEGTTNLGDEESHGSKVDTTDVLFILCGAHVGLDDVIKQRLANRANACKFIGFKENNTMKKEGDAGVAAKEENEMIPTTEDLVLYGYLPELVGRITLVTRYRHLMEKDLYQILKISKLSPSENYALMFRDIGCRLSYTDNALALIAKKAATLNLGARGLRKVLSKIIYPIYYNVEETGKDITITSRTVDNTAGPIIKPEEKLTEKRGGFLTN